MNRAVAFTFSVDKAFKNNKNRIVVNPFLFKIDRFESIDIDEEYDFPLS